MIGHGWMTLKQAQEALRAGRLEEAHQLLLQPQIQGHRRCLDLLHQLMRSYVDRGERHLRNDEFASAWTDLLKAEELGITDNAPLRLRQALTRIGLAEVRALLDAGQPGRALESIQQLRERAVRQPDLDALEQGAKEWVAASEYTDKGDFPQAVQTLDRAASLLPAHGRVLAQARAALEQKQREFGPLVQQLHEAARQEHWPEVLQVSEKLLTLAPKHAEVRRLRGKAWKALEPATVLLNKQQLLPPPPPVAETPAKTRLILWIDGVGGYLLLLDNVVSIGQGGPDATADLPLLADVSRYHAKLSRDTEGYVLEAARPVSVNNQPVHRHLLKTGERITLGTTCQLLFRQEVPVSASARLDIVSGHRFGQAVDGVLLMAETLLLGPTEQAHVQIPDLKSPVILYRNREELGIRSAEEMTMNGSPVRGRGVLEPGCHVSGSGFSLSLELVNNSRNTGHTYR